MAVSDSVMKLPPEDLASQSLDPGRVRLAAGMQGQNP